MFAYTVRVVGKMSISLYASILDPDYMPEQWKLLILCVIMQGVKDSSSWGLQMTK
jgi:hypothetical protein